MNRKFLATALLCMVFLTCTAAAAANTAEQPQWPSFHGPNQDNISLETGLLKKWPKEGPKLIWQYPECGRGFSMVSFAEDMIFTAGDFGDDEMVIALNMDGKLLWKSPNGKSWKDSHPGSRTVPTYDNGVLYHMNPTGTLSAFRATSGKVIWSVDLSERFDVRYGIWALSENLVVADDLVLCMPGGSKGRVVALNKHTGRTVWKNTELDDIAAYCSPVLATHKGVRQYITLTGKRVVSIDAKTGKLLWSYPHPTPYNQSVTTPIFNDGYVFITSGHSGGGRLLKISDDQRSAAQIWYRKDIDSCHGGVVLIDGRMYGSSCRLGGKIFFCTDFLTGKIRQQDRTLGKLSLTYADGMIYGLNTQGTMSLIKITPEGFTVVSSFKVPDQGSGQFLSHPVIYGRRMYIRHWNNLYVYDISAM